MTKPRVLIIENSIAVTGALKSIVRSSLYLREFYEFEFILPRKSKGVELVLQQGFSCRELPMKEIRKNFFAMIFYIPFLLFNTVLTVRLIRTLKIDLIVSNDLYNLIPSLYRLLGGKVPYVCYVRFLPSKFPALLVKLWYTLHDRLASSIIAVSEAVRRELPGTRKVVVIGNELPQMEEVPYSPARSSLILYPANYIRGKGQEYALESFAAISKRFPEWKLRFIGGDMGLRKNIEFKASLIKRAEQLGVADQTEWLGFITDVAAQYGGAAIVLNFSESESFSLTCLEAMFYGRAVISTDSGGPSEIIDAGETGVLVPVGDVPSMTKAIEFFILHPDKKNEVAYNAYKRIRVKFSDEKITEELRRAYSSSFKN